ncbi:MAG: hypothetical protein AAFU79_35645, partial [Myxococcota bacterium]
HGGFLVGFLHRSEEALTSFVPETDGEAHARALAEALAARVRSGLRRSQLLAKIDGEDPRAHPLRPVLEQEGFRMTGAGLLLRTPQEPRPRRGGGATVTAEDEPQAWD